MKKIFYKITAIVLLGIAVYPAVAMAVWWNPFTWFKKKLVTPIEQVEVTKTKNTYTQGVKDPVKKNTTPQNKNSELSLKENKILAPTVSAAPESIKPEVSVSILNINVETTHKLAYISWQTSIPAESKILLDGKVYYSKNNVSTLHYAEIDLNSGASYIGTITALANNTWVNKEITFSMRQEPTPPPTPLQITVGNKNCTFDSCKIEWQTNYPTTSSITITKVNQDNVSWSFESENISGTGHWKTFNNLSPSTQYFFSINAVSNSGSKQIQESFYTKEKPDIPQDGNCYAPSSGGVQVRVLCPKTNSSPGASA